MTALPWVLDDGGRAAAGFRGNTRDCVARSIAIATGVPYAEAYRALNEGAGRERPGSGRRRSSARLGVHKQTSRRYMESLGWEFVPTMAIGTGCRVHLAQGELPGGRIIAVCSRHWTAVVDGVIHDTFDCSRDGTRCVYGYYRERTVRT